jgi:hypothetical protein
MIFFATSRSFIPEAWNEQSSPQSLQQKTCISIASYELRHYPLILLNKCKAMKQCRPSANRLNYLSFQRQRVSGTVTGTGITKIPSIFSRTIMMWAGPVNQILKNAILLVAIMTSPLKIRQKTPTAQSACFPATYPDSQYSLNPS